MKQRKKLYKLRSGPLIKRGPLLLGMLRICRDFCKFGVLFGVNALKRGCFSIWVKAEKLGWHLHTGNGGKQVVAILLNL